MVGYPTTIWRGPPLIFCRWSPTDLAGYSPIFGGIFPKNPISVSGVHPQALVGPRQTLVGYPPKHQWRLQRGTWGHHPHQRSAMGTYPPLKVKYGDIHPPNIKGAPLKVKGGSAVHGDINPIKDQPWGQRSKVNHGDCHGLSRPSLLAAVRAVCMARARP